MAARRHEAAVNTNSVGRNLLPTCKHCGSTGYWGASQEATKLGRDEHLRHPKSGSPMFLVPTHRPLSSSFLGLPYGILNKNHKKELLRGLWVELELQSPAPGHPPSLTSETRQVQVWALPPLCPPRHQLPRTPTSPERDAYGN